MLGASLLRGDASASPRPIPALDVERSRKVDGALVYAIGDVHGRYDLLTVLLATITADARSTAAGRRPVLILLGDYVDRGPASSKVLAALAWLRRRGDFELHLLRGNHEAVMLDYIESPGNVREWMRFGGDATLRSYGVEPPDELAPLEVHERARDALLDRMPAAHLRLLQSLDLTVHVGDYAFVHAGVRRGVPLDAQSIEDMLWIRKGFVDDDHPFDRIVVHGHTWRDDAPDHRVNRIGIDTGAYDTGVLTALRLEDDSQTFLEARDADLPPG